MSSGAEHVLDMVTKRLHSEPDRVLPTLRLLIDGDALVQVDDVRTLELARTLNTQRLTERRAAFQRRALTTAQVSVFSASAVRPCRRASVTVVMLIRLGIGRE